MTLSPADEVLLMRAVDLAHGSIGLSEPNPRVGCVLHDAVGALAGEGFTQQAGGPHAEIVALGSAARNGFDVRGGTAWVSLEPCAHHGRTPPCSDALIQAGLARVVVALADPFPEVAGRGIARLREAGIVVDNAESGPARNAAMELTIGFLSRVLRQRPWVRMKVAASLDGRTALPNGVSQWITSAEARLDGHRWRHRASAILTGIGTVRSDDPRLDVRLIEAARQPMRVVVDSSLALPPNARILQPPGQTCVIHADAAGQRISALTAKGATVHSLPDANGRVDLMGLMTWLAQSGVNELHVEAGATLNAALLENRLVDELLVYLAPKLIGPGSGFAALPALEALDRAAAFQFTDAVRVGVDLRITARAEGSRDFLPR